MIIDTVLYQPLVEAVARETAKIVIAGLREGGSVQPRLMDGEQAAMYLGLPSYHALAQRKWKGQVPDYCYVKMGTSVMYDRVGLDRWVEELKDEN